VDELVKLRSEFYRSYILRPRFAMEHLWKHGRFYMHNRDILRTLLGIRKLFKAHGSGNNGKAGALSSLADSCDVKGS
jgi:hypothetical protein